jgi:hypothetical protein
MLGFAMVPSRRWAVHTVGAVVTGIVGVIGKSRIDVLTQDHAKPALAQAILDGGLDNLDATMTAVQSIQQQFGLIDEDFEALCTEM